MENEKPEWMKTLLNVVVFSFSKEKTNWGHFNSFIVLLVSKLVDGLRTRLDWIKESGVCASKLRGGGGGEVKTVFQTWI